MPGYIDGYLETPNFFLEQFPGITVTSYAELLAAITAAGALETTIYCTRAQYSLAAPLVVPANIELRAEEGALFVLGDNDLTISGPIEAGPYQIFSLAGTGTVIPSGASLAGILPEHFGVVGDGTTDNATALNKYFSVLSACTVPVTAKFQPGSNYAFGSTVSLGLPHGSSIAADGATFTFTNDGVGFDVNPAFTAVMPLGSEVDTYTLIDTTWSGGQFFNTNAVKTASVAVQAYFMRGFRMYDCNFGDRNDDGKRFFAGVKFGGKDTYRFVNCSWFYNDHQCWVPPEGTLYGAAFTGNVLTDVVWQSCSMTSTTGNVDHVLVEDSFDNMKFIAGNFNGTFSNASIELISGTQIASDSLAFLGCHWEQMPASLPTVKFTDTGTTGFDNINFDEGCRFYSSIARWGGVSLDNCRFVRFGNVKFINAASTPGASGPAYGVYVDNNSTFITFAKECNFQYFLTPYGTEANVSTMANSGAGLIRVTTVSNHSFETGDRVFIRGVSGTVEANGMWVVTKFDATHFDLQGSTFVNAYVGGGSPVYPLNAVTVESTACRQNITVEPNPSLSEKVIPKPQADSPECQPKTNHHQGPPATLPGHPWALEDVPHHQVISSLVISNAANIFPHF